MAVVLLGGAGMLAFATPAAASASPTLVTTPKPAKVTLGAAAAPTLTDSAVLAGGSSPTGTITFTLFVNGTPVDTETVTVSGNGTYTTPVGFALPTVGAVTGTYQWDATYSGDANNNAASDTGNPGERVVVTKARTAIKTTPKPAKVTLGAAAAPRLTDSAVLASGYHETGTLTFTLFVNGSGAPVDTETVTVSGNGTYTTPVGFALPTVGAVTGTYQWDATYSGDANNNAASDTDNPGERVVVTEASPAITAKPGRTVVTGSALSDSAKLTSGASPTGTITFRLYGPNGHLVYNDHVAVSGNGSYTTAAGDHPGGFIPAVAGTYQWVAAYSGDSRNKAVSTRRGAEPGRAVYGFGGFLSPPAKSTLKSGSTINVKFRLTNTAGQPIARAIAAKLAARHDVTTTLTGRGIKRRPVSCTWIGAHRYFQCKIKTPRGVRTGRANPYLITAFENVGAGSVRALAVSSATTPNPETIFFKKTRAR